MATNMAGRGVDIILGGNPPLSDEAQKAREAGGLHVIGTERHEARRIDNQLRGRAGRQGDHGSSQFFLSLEDDLLRIFGGERIKNLMESFNLPEDQPIESRLISRVVNEAQKKIEGINFDGRKHLLEYDDVLNKQRTVFYKKRQEIIFLPVGRQECLMMLDMLWMNHLENIEALREGVGMRAYGQHDPLVEYRREGYAMFKEMMANFEKWQNENAERLSQTTINNQQLMTNVISRQTLVASHNKIGRNDPCPCGSGKKYKRCHGQ